MNNKVRDFLASMCFSGPSFLGMLAFYIIPFLIVVYYSFTAGLTDHSFAGLKNYINVCRTARSRSRSRIRSRSPAFPCRWLSCCLWDWR